MRNFPHAAGRGRDTRFPISQEERQVSICAKDSGGPYNYDVVSRQIALAKEKGIDFAVDIYPFYSSGLAEFSTCGGARQRHPLSYFTGKTSLRYCIKNRAASFNIRPPVL